MMHRAAGRARGVNDVADEQAADNAAIHVDVDRKMGRPAPLASGCHQADSLIPELSITAPGRLAVDAHRPPAMPSGTRCLCCDAGEGSES